MTKSLFSIHVQFSKGENELKSLCGRVTLKYGVKPLIHDLAEKAVLLVLNMWALRPINIY